VEPFNQWFKSLFELDTHVWHRGVNNNRTQILGAVFAYQLLVRHNFHIGRNNGRVRWIIDALGIPGHPQAPLGNEGNRKYAKYGK
jgi:hypothetical protein